MFKISIITMLFMLVSLKAVTLNSNINRMFTVVANEEKISKNKLIKIGFIESKFSHYSALLNARDYYKTRKLLNSLNVKYLVGSIKYKSKYFKRLEKALKHYKIRYKLDKGYLYFNRNKKTTAILNYFKKSYSVIYPKYFSININNSKVAKRFYFSLKRFMKNNPKAIKDYDLGLMMINRRNLAKLTNNEYKYYMNTYLNIRLGAKILKGCIKRFKRKYNQIECYNKGNSVARFKKAGYDYFKKYNRVRIRG